MATDLLCPPLEVLRGIYGLLLYPELTKLRMTCRQLRQIGADDIVRSALLQLEDDWAEAALKEQEHYTAGINVSPSILLRAWGYDNERERAEFEQHLLPCYGCLEIRHSDSFLPSQTLCEVTINAVAFANLNQQRPNAVATRKCARWGPANTQDVERYWMAICRSCEDLVESDDEPPARQRRADLCEECFRQVPQEWFLHQYEVGQRRHILQQQIRDLQARDEGLSKYCQWMDKVDDGARVVQDRPPYLDGLEMPDMGAMRPDAIVKLPDKEERKRAILRR